LERVDLGDVRSRFVGAELGQDQAERWPPEELDFAERVTQRSRERHVGQVLLELAASRPPDADADQAGRKLVEQARLAEPGVALDLEQRKRAVQGVPCGALEQIELGPPPEGAARAPPDPRRRAYDRARQQCAHVLLTENRGLER